jgi:Na+/H+-dicarboxylate symporter
VGIWSLICGAVLNMDDPKLVFAKISYYAMTVLIGLFIHGFIVLPLIYVITTRKNILVYTKNMLEAFLVAIATSSRFST